MKTKPLFFASGLLAFVAGCTTTPVKVSRVPVKADAHFTIACFEPSQVDVPAKLTKIVPPRVRMRSAGDGLDGYARVQYIVDTDGIPLEVQWVEASDALFASLAATSVAESRYSPAKKDGKAVAMKMEARIEYHMPAFLASGSRYDDHSYAGPQNQYDNSGIFVNNYYHQ